MKIDLRSGRLAQVARLAADFALAMGVIWLIPLITPVYHERTFLMFSLATAAIATLDLAFLRHLRRAYASQRRSVWRRV